MAADVRLYRSACVWCLPILLVGLPSWPLAALSALAWWLLGKMTISSGAIVETSHTRMLVWGIFRRRPTTVRLSVEGTMRVVMIVLSVAMLSGNILDGAWLGGDDLAWFWVRLGVEVGLGFVGGLVSAYVGRLRERRGAVRGLKEGRDVSREVLRRYAAADAPATSPQASSAH